MVELPLALVTGASQRIGRATALLLAKKGYAILLHYNLSLEAAEKTAVEIQDLGVPVFMHQSDLADPAGIESLSSYCTSLKNNWQVLINSAAIMPARKSHGATAEDFDAIFDLNLRAPFLLSQSAFNWMGDRGLIVNISDVGARKLWTGYKAYVIAKASLESMTNLLAKAYAPKLRVNAIAPGLVMPSGGTIKASWESLLTQIPLQRSVELSDLESALSLLIDTRSITGQTVVLDGGWSLI